MYTLSAGERAVSYISYLSNDRSVCMSRVKITLRGLVVFVALCSMGLSAQTISPQMLQQLQSLPRAQQEVMAKQYGVDLDKILGGVEGKADTKSNIGTPGMTLEQTEVLSDEDIAEQETRRLFEEKYAEFRASRLEDNDKPERYGKALFNREVSTFAPTDDASVPDNYRLGAGDHLVVQLFGKDSAQYDLQLGRDGKISFPKLGPITLAGLTFEAARDLVQSRVVEQLIGVQAAISMGRLRAINVFMAGEVAIPGAYSVSALTTITQALFQAGGISDIGSLRNIQVKRDGREVANFDVYQLLLKGDASADLRLQSGDVVFVPPYEGLVTVVGSVNRPMIYEYLEGESVADAIFMAGGFNQDAYVSAISVLSKAVGKDLPEVKSIDLILSKETVALRNGDIVSVPMSTDNLKNAVTLEGAVVRPGIFGWVPGQRVSDLVRSLEGDLKIYADLDYALIVRQKNQKMDVDILQINLLAAVTNKESADNILTAPRDKIIIFALPNISVISSQETESSNKTNLEDDVTLVRREVLLEPIIEKLISQARDGEPVQIISVSGSVKAPGTYPLGKNYTVAKLLSAAGGLKDNAYLKSAELRSLYVNELGEVVSRYVKIDLNAEINSLTETLIKSRDHLFVRELPDWNPDDSVIVEGEVRFPGEYRIRKNETLSSVIERAGGLVSGSFPEGTIFTRESVAEQENIRAKEFADLIIRDFAAAQLTKEENTASIDEIKVVADILENFSGLGRLLVDINGALAGDKNADLTLEHGDTVTIPRQNSTITMVGEIRRPGTHSYLMGLDIKDYIGLSAGFNARADKGQVYVVRADGSVFRPSNSWILFSGPQGSLAPGDTIVVPIYAGYTDKLSMARELTQIIFNSTAGLASIVAATK